MSIHLSRGRLGDLPGGGRGRARRVEKTDIEHVDSRNVSVGLGLIVRAAAEAAAAGKTPRRRSPASRGTRPTGRALFIAVPTLEHLVRGGRVSPLQGAAREAARAAAGADDLARRQGEPAAKARGFAGGARER